MKTRMLSLLLALALLAGMLPAPVNAEAEAGQAPASGVSAAEGPVEAPDEEPAEEPAGDPAVEAVQAMIDALPEEDMSEEAAEALEEAYAAFNALDGAQQARIVGYDRLEALFRRMSSQVSSLAGEQSLSGNVTWKNQALTSGFQLDGDTTLTLEGANTLQCDAPLDLQGHTLTIQGTGSLDIISTGIAVDDYYITSSTAGGTFALKSGKVTVTGGNRGLNVRNISVTGGELHVEASVGGIDTASLTVTGGSLYTSGGRAAIYCYQGGKTRKIDDSLTVLYSQDADGAIATMEEGSAQDTCRDKEVKTVYIGKIAPRPTLTVSETQQGTLYEGLEGQTAAFSLSWKSVDISTLSVAWADSHPGLTERLSADSKTLTVLADSAAKQGSYRLTLTVTGNDGTTKTRTAAVIVSGPPITVTGQPESIVLHGGNIPVGMDRVQVTASLGSGLTGSVGYQWKLADGTALAGYTESTLSVLSLFRAGKLTKDESKPWLLSARVFCRLTYDTYSLDTDTVTLAVSECTHPLSDLQGKCRQCGETIGTGPLLVKEDGTYSAIDEDAAAGKVSVGGFLQGGGTFYLTGDLQTRAIDVSNGEASGGNVILELQGHALDSLQLGNFPYDTFTVQNGTLAKISTDADGALTLENMHFLTGIDFPDRLNLTVQGEDTQFSLPPLFYGVTHLRGGSFLTGLDAQNAARALPLLDEGFAFQDGSGRIIDAAIPGNLVGHSIRVVSHSCNYVNGKCACGRSCNHVGTVDENGYCTNCRALVHPYAIGQALYTSLEEALDAAQAGDTITLRGDYFQENVTVEITKSVTLDLGGHTLSGDPEAPLLRVLVKDVTIQHGGVTNTRAAKSSPAVAVGKMNVSDAELTVKSVCFTGSTTRQEPRGSGLTVAAGNHAAVISGTFNGGIYVEGSLTMTGGSADSLRLGYVLGNIRLSDCAFNSIQFLGGADYASLLAPDYAYQSNTGWMKLEEMTNSAGAKILKCSHPDGLSDTAACPYCGKKCGHTSTSLDTGLCPDCGLQVYAAKIGATPYATLTAALEQVQAWETVTMLADCELPADYTLTRETQLNINGKNLTGTTLTVEAPFTLRGGMVKVPISVNSKMTLQTISGRLTYLKEPVYVNDSGSLSITAGNASVYTVYVSTGGSLELRSGSIGRLYIDGGRATLISGTIGYGISMTNGNILSILAEGKALAMANGTIIDGSLSGIRANLKIVDHRSHTFPESGKCACGVQAAASVTAQDGSITCYRSITEAIAAATQSPDGGGHCGTTVTLLNDIPETVSNHDFDFTLDLNGKTVAELNMSGFYFDLMDSKETGTIQKFTTTSLGGAAFLYLKEGWSLIGADGTSPDLLTRLNTSDPIQVVFSGVKDIERRMYGAVSYGQQKNPFSLRFALEDPAEVRSVQVSWSDDSYTPRAIGPAQTLSRGSDGFYTFDNSQTITVNPLDYTHFRPDHNYVLLAKITLTLNSGEVRSIVLRGFNLQVDKASLSDAEVTLASSEFPFLYDPQSGTGMEQTVAVTSVTLYGKDLVEGTDYVVSGGIAIDAGDYTVTVKACPGSKYYTGSKNVAWKIKPLVVRIDDTSLPGKTYDGTAAAQVPALTMKDADGNGTLVFHENTDYVVESALFDSPDAGKQPLRFAVHLTGTKAKNFVLAQSDAAIMSEIYQASPLPSGNFTFTVSNGSTDAFTLDNLGILLARLDAPCTYGDITYGTPAVDLKAEGYAVTAGIDGHTLNLAVTDTGSQVGQVAVITIPVTTRNYRDIRLTVYVDAKNKIVPTVDTVETADILYGQKLEESKVTSYRAYASGGVNSIPGTFRWKEPDTVLKAGEHTMEMIFEPTDTDTYASCSTQVHVTVTPRPVTLSGVTVLDRFYDGTTDAEIYEKGTFSNTVPGDTVTYTVTGSFADGKVARNEADEIIPKPVTLEVTLTGESAKNYTLAADSQTEATAAINCRCIYVTGGIYAQDRDYDPDDALVQVTKGVVTFDDQIAGDDLDVRIGYGMIFQKDAGENIKVFYTLSLTGADAGNYVLMGYPSLTVNIRRIPQSLSFTEKAVTKTYGDAPFDNILMRSAGDGSLRYSSTVPAVATVDAKGTVTIHGAGTTRIIAEAGETTNYTATETAFDLTVAKAAGTLENKDYPLAYTYSGSSVPAPDMANFTTNNPDGNFRFSWMRNGAPFTTGFVPIDAETYQLRVTVDASDNYEAVSRDFTVTVTPLDISGNKVQINLGRNLTYNGSRQTQAIDSVTVDGISENVTYTVTGNTGTDAKDYTLTVTGKGNFSGSKTADWSIAPKSIENATVSLGQLRIYNGLPVTMDVEKVEVDGLRTTFDVSGNTQTNAGTYVMTITGTGNFTGVKETPWRIGTRDLLEAAVILGEFPIYDGTLKTQKVISVTFPDISETLVEGRDYVVWDNTATDVRDEGYQLIISGRGNFSDGIGRSWHILPRDIGDASVTLGKDLTYDGTEQTKTVDSVAIAGVTGDVTYTVTGNTAADAGDYRMTLTGTGNFTGTATAPWSIARKDVTIEKTAAAPSKVYDGTTAAAIRDIGTLSENFDGKDLQILPGTASYDDKNVGTGKPVSFAGFTLTGSKADNYRLTGQPASVTADITVKNITLTVTVKDKPFDGNTQAELDRLTHEAFAEADDIRLVPGTPSFAFANAKANIPIVFTAFALEGKDAANYRLTNPQPENVTASITPTSDYLDMSDRPEEEVWVNGEKYPVSTDGGRYVRLPGEGDLLTAYTMDASGGYPTGMKVYRINRQENGAALTEIPEFANLLLYVGCSIRLNGTKGIRMITSVDQSVKKSLTSAAGLAGYTLEEYGTVVMRGVGTPTLENTDSHNFAYKKGQADPVFAKADGRIQYTNVLVGFSLEDCKDDLTLRPYITLKDTASGKTVTLYGGCVTRSIGYIAKQNESLYKPGSAGYKYIREIIDAVYG